jgi:hypothetical protein
MGVPEIMTEQARLARDHGMHGFCLNYFRYGMRQLERPPDS